MDKERKKLMRDGSGDPSRRSWRHFCRPALPSSLWPSSHIDAWALCSSIYSLGRWPAHTKSLTGGDPWLKNVQSSDASSGALRDHPTCHLQLEAQKAPHPILLRPFLHSPHPPPPLVHSPTVRVGNLRCNCPPHLQCQTRVPLPSRRPF